MGATLASTVFAVVVAVSADPAIAQSNAAADPEGAPLSELLGQRGREAVDGPAKLEADEITYDPDAEVVRASGDVQVFYGDRVLRADELVYDAKNDLISAKGNIRLINPDGSVLSADEAQFDSKIRDGLIVGAKAVLADGRSRLASVEGRRVDGRFTQLSKTVFSPCEVCEDDPTPLWRIRARRVIQDEEARDVIYEDATFDVFGVPIFYTPYFRHADPSVERRSGFLTPSFGSTSELGATAQIPYYYTFAPNRDLTVTPYILTEDNPVLIGEYRSRLDSGQYIIGGSVTSSNGTVTDDSPSRRIDQGFRGHFEGAGAFAVGSGFTAGFDSLIASDDGYLRRYRFSGVDRAATEIYVRRFENDGFVSTEAQRYQSFREDELSGDIPLVAPLAEFEQFYDAPVIGGEFQIGGSSLFLRRTEGRDVGRLSGSLGWSRTSATSFGLVMESSALVRGDLYRTLDDANNGDGYDGRVLPLAALRISYPFGKVGESSSQVIEPIATLVYAPYGGNPESIPNEDSLSVDLDELRIFAPLRITGIDRWEDGPRATAGVRYNRMSMDGWEIDLAAGQSYRLRETDVFSAASGLTGTESDYVGSFRIAFDPVFSLGQRTRVGTDFTVNRYEAFGSAVLFDRLTLDGGYVFATADPVADAGEDRAELTGGAALRVTDYWTVTGGFRRNLEEDRFVSARAGLRYSDECAELDLGMRRRFNDVDDAGASTDFGIQIRLKGLEASAGPSRSADPDERELGVDNDEPAVGVANNGCSRLPNAQ